MSGFTQKPHMVTKVLGIGVAILTSVTGCDNLLGGDDDIAAAPLGGSFTLPAGTIQEISFIDGHIEKSPWTYGEVTLYATTISAMDLGEGQLIIDDDTYEAAVVNASGRFPEVQIGTPPPHKLLWSKEIEMQEQFRANPEEFRFTIIYGFLCSNEEIGVLRRSISQKSGSWTVWFYVDRDVEIIGTHSDGYDDGEFTYTHQMALNLKTGWNRVVQTTTYTEDSIKTIVKTRGEPPETGWLVDMGSGW